MACGFFLRNSWPNFLDFSRLSTVRGQPANRKNQNRTDRTGCMETFKSAFGFQSGRAIARPTRAIARSVNLYVGLRPPKRTRYRAPGTGRTWKWNRTGGTGTGRPTNRNEPNRTGTFLQIGETCSEPKQNQKYASSMDQNQSKPESNSTRTTLNQNLHFLGFFYKARSVGTELGTGNWAVLEP